MTRKLYAADVSLQGEKFSADFHISLIKDQEFHYVMALKGRCHIYETAFDSKVDKKNEEGGDLIDRIAIHPILQLLHIRRKSKPSNVYDSPNKNSNVQPKSVAPSTSKASTQQVCEAASTRHSARFPARSASSNQLWERRNLRPIGLSKSDDEILNRASDSHEEEDEDCLEDYREGSHAQDLANDLHSLHVTSQKNSFAAVAAVAAAGPAECDAAAATDANRHRDPAIRDDGIQRGTRHRTTSPSVQFSSAQSRPLDKPRIPIPHRNSTRPFTSSLTKFCSKVQPQKSLNEPKVHLIQGEISKSQLLPLKKGLQPLKLHSPPGTAPLPVKFCKKTPVMEKNPSSWFSPVRQKDLRLPIKRSFLSQSEKGSTNSSASSLNDSMVVLVDAGSRRDLKDCLVPPVVSVNKYSSVDSVVTGSAMSSLESLRSSMSDGSKSTTSNESAAASFSNYKSSSLGSESSSSCSSSSRPFLNLNAPHRSLIQSAKFQILSPISDKSQEPSLETAGGLSQTSSPQDFLELTNLANHQKPPSHAPRNIQDDFRNVHHILPQPPPNQGKPGSDSGISTEYKNQGSTPLIPSSQQAANRGSKHTAEIPFNDLPFDMPKLRRRLALAKASLSSSNSSISSSAHSSEANARFSLPSNAALSISQPISSLNPAISRLQMSSNMSGTSSSNSSDWDTRSSAESSEGREEGTPKFPHKQGRKSLALELGCSAMSVKGQEIDVNLPLNKQSWYHGVINRQEAESLLRNRAEGSYIVRSIRSSKWDYSLALKSARGFMHFRMRFDHSNRGYTIGRSEKLFPSVPHIISHFSIYRIPIKGADHMVLLHPIPSETL